MVTTEEQIKLATELRYHYFDKKGFASISDNETFTKYIKEWEPVGNIPELAFLHVYLDYDHKTKITPHNNPTITETQKLIQTKKIDSNIDWNAIYNYLDELKTKKWEAFIEEEIQDAIDAFEPFRKELTTTAQYSIDKNIAELDKVPVPQHVADWLDKVNHKLFGLNYDSVPSEIYDWVYATEDNLKKIHLAAVAGYVVEENPQ